MSKKQATQQKQLPTMIRRFNKIETDLLVIKWMIGLVIIVEVLPILKNLL